MIFDPFILRAIVAGVAIAIISGPMGCFVVWRRMAYFGDALSHSALLGVALGLLSGINPNFGIIAACFAFSILLLSLQHQNLFSNDTLLGILAHTFLAGGVVLLSLFDNNIDLHDYLFGSILTVDIGQIYWIYAVVLVVLFLLFSNWSSLILMVLDENLLMAEGKKLFPIRLLFMFLMTLVVAASIQITGVLLMVSMLIIPAATANYASDSPETMAIIASLLGGGGISIGLLLSFYWDIPSGPTIILVLVMFFICLLLARISQRASQKIMGYFGK